MGEIQGLGREGEESSMPIHMRNPVAVIFGLEVCGWKKMAVWGEEQLNGMNGKRKKNMKEFSVALTNYQHQKLSTC